MAAFLEKIYTATEDNVKTSDVDLSDEELIDKY